MKSIPLFELEQRIKAKIPDAEFDGHLTLCRLMELYMAISCDNYPCGHPRTEANTKLHGNGKACRTCRQVIERRAQAKRRGKQKIRGAGA